MPIYNELRATFFSGGIEIQLNFHCDVPSDVISTLFHLYPQTHNF